MTQSRQGAPMLRYGASPDVTSGGVILIVVLGVLTVLVLIGLVFITVAGIERATSRNYADTVHAKFLARSGIEMAVTLLPDMEFIEQGLSPAIYGLEFDDANGNGRYDPATEKVNTVNNNIALERCRFPSLKGQDNPDGEPAEVLLTDQNSDGNPDTLGYSGSLPPEYSGGKDVYSLRIRDCASMIYVNGPSVSTQDLSLAPNAKRMLDNLGAQFNIQNFGRIISDERVQLKRNLLNREEIKTALKNAGYGDAYYRSIKDYVTCYGWVDEKTLLPGALRPVNADNPNYKWSFLQDSNGHRIVHAFEIPDNMLACCGEDYIVTNKNTWVGIYSNPTPPAPSPPVPTGGATSLVQPRAPININTAQEPVLIAVFEGLQGFYLDRALKNTTSPGERKLGNPISSDLARNIASEIIVWRKDKPFLSYKNFNVFIDNLGLFNNYQKMVIKANANPNSHMVKFNPNKTFGGRFGDTDKSDLGEWSPSLPNGNCGWNTEFCFSSMGCYEIESLGCVLSPPTAQGFRRVLARRKVSTIVKIYDVLRHTTQKDFEKYGGRDYPLSTTGVMSFPESIADLKSSSYWSTVKTLCLDKPESDCRHNLCYDGYVTLRPQDIRPMSLTTLQADYNDTLVAIANGDGKAYGWADEDRSLIDTNDPSELFPDGVFCHETRRSKYSNTQVTYGNTDESVDEYLYYKAINNFPLTGSLELWFKPTWNFSELKPYEDTRALFTMGFGEDDNYYAKASSWEHICLFARNQLSESFIGAMYCDCEYGGPPYTKQYPYRLIPQIHYGAWASPGKGMAKMQVNWSAGEWHHLAMSWNKTDMRLFVDGIEAYGSPLVPYNNGTFYRGILADWNICIGNGRFEGANTPLCNGYPLNADGTIDSLRIYNTELPGPDITPDRYGADGSFTASFPSDDFPAVKDGGRLGRISWTWYQPSNGTGDIEFAVTAGSNAMPVSPGTAGNGYNLNLPLQPGETLSYNVKFIAPDPNARGFVDETPILDDVTITFLTAPKFVAYFME
ncbi:MAG: hypothetical protein HY762_08135 [Planctomycetes bacterium]|nr:hypothetical protein [Planctomycetota bacterium]